MRSLIGLVMVTTLLGVATRTSAQLAEPAPEELRAFASQVMTSTLTRGETQEAAESARQSILQVRDAEARNVHEAQRLFLLAFAEQGFAARGQGSIARADDLLEQSADLVRTANRRAPTSEGYRILADCLNQLLDIRGVAYKMLNIGPARRAAEQAVALDPQNPLAHLAAAALLTSAPRVVGGNPELAGAHLRDAARVSDGSDYIEFLIRLWNFRHAVNHGSPDQARTYFLSARAIYPDNWLLKSAAKDAGIR